MIGEAESTLAYETTGFHPKMHYRLHHILTKCYENGMKSHITGLITQT